MTVVIKRYPNRKLYDTEARHYVALDRVAEVIRGGGEVQVVDHATGADITAVILSQVIADQERRRVGLVPHDLLAALVQASGDRVIALRRALASPLERLRQVDEEIERRLAALVAVGELGEEDGRRLRDKLVALGQRAYDELTLAQLPAVRNLPTRGDLQALAARLDALEVEIERLSAR